MRTTLYFVVATLSLAVCTATAAFWGRCAWATDKAWRDTAQSSTELTSNRAGILFIFFRAGWQNPFSSGYGYRSSRPTYLDAGTDFVAAGSPGFICDYALLGFRFAATRGGSATSIGSTINYQAEWELRVPHWGALMFSASIGAIAIRLAAKRRPRKDGHCRLCGYDLRATPGRCPECGNVPGGAV